MLRPVIPALALALLGACVTSSTIEYLPSPEQPRLGLEGGRAMIQRFVGPECGRLEETGRAAGEAELVVTTDGAGLATSATLRRSTGDARVDGVLGAVAAQLDLGAAAARSRAALRAGFRCSTEGVVATLEHR